MNKLKPYEYHEIEVNGKEYVFHVFNDLTQPCSYCGIQACGRVDYFWFVTEEGRQTLLLDGGILGGMINEYFSRPDQKTDYAILPKFLRESNEYRGWCIADDFNGTELDIADLLEALCIIENEHSETLTKQYLIAIEKIAVHALENKTKLFVARS